MNTDSRKPTHEHIILVKWEMLENYDVQSMSWLLTAPYNVI